MRLSTTIAIALVLSVTLCAQAAPRASAPSSARKLELERIEREIASEGLQWRPNEDLSALDAPHALGGEATTVPNPTQVSVAGVFSALGPQALPTAAVLPPSLDFTSRLGAVRDQGACGTCTTFATVAALEAEANLSLGQITDYSEQDVVACSGIYSTCALGATIPAVAGYLVSLGTVTEGIFPYTATFGTFPACTLSYTTQKAQAVKARSWNGYNIGSAADLRYLLYNLQRPVVVVMRVYNDFYSYGSGIYSPTSGSTFEGLHAVLVVGYSDAEQSFRVRNSWGTGWGESGYFRIRYAEVASGSLTQFAAGSSAIALFGITASGQPTAARCTSTTATTAYCDLSVAAGNYADFVVSATAKATSNGTNSGQMQLNLSNDNVACNLNSGITYGVDNETVLGGSGFTCTRRVHGGQTIRVAADSPNNRADGVYTIASATFTEQSIASEPTDVVCVNDTPSSAHCEMSTALAKQYADFIVTGDALATSNGTNSGSMQLNMSIDGVPCNSQYGVTYGIDNDTRLTGPGFTCTTRIYSGQQKQIVLLAPNNIADAVYTTAAGSVVAGPDASNPGASVEIFADGLELNFSN